MPSPSIRNLTRKPPTSGDDVTDWQTFLAAQGFDANGIDGSFGPGTESATMAFQTANGLIPDGKVGNLTYAKAISLGFLPLQHVNQPVPKASISAVAEIAGVTVYKLSSGQAVFYTAGMQVDADGCPEAYHPKNIGIEDVRNAEDKDGKISADVVLFEGGIPYIQPSGKYAGYYVSQTSLRDPDASQAKNPASYVNALTVSYIVLPGGKLGGAKVGDVALVIDSVTGNRVKAVVADGGPKLKIGEASIYCAGLAIGRAASVITGVQARVRGDFTNPRNGGTDEKRFRYIVFPGTGVSWPFTNNDIAAKVDGALASLTAEQILAITGSKV